MLETFATVTTDLPVLLVDDDEATCSVMAFRLHEAGVKNVQSISDSGRVLPYLQENRVALVLLDLVMPHPSGHELLCAIRSEYPCVQVVVVSGANELSAAVECMKRGALDYLSKPVEATRMVACVKNALTISAMQGELQSLKRRMLDDSLDSPGAFEAIKTCSSKMRSLFQYTEAIARFFQPILITGETGVGKELMARAIHSLSGRGGEFVSVNVAGLDDSIFSDTLFGHQKGAFTGAEQTRHGLITAAAGGTLFLDEIGDLDERSQIKLLRLLQEDEYYPVGSDKPKKSTARIVAATNQHLPDRVAEKQFRRDLYYRLCTHEIHIPPLRERCEDIPLLLEHYLHEASNYYQKNMPTLTASAVSRLVGLSFPGNVRELKAMVYDAVVRSIEGELTAQSFSGNKLELPAPNGSSEQTIDALFGHFPTLNEVEEFVISEALRRSAGNRNLAATMLGITSRTITNHQLKSGAAPEKARKQDLVPRGKQEVHP